MKNKIFNIDITGVFNYQECLWNLDRGYDECLYKLTHNSITRAQVFDNEVVLFKISLTDTGIAVEVINDVNFNQNQLIAYIIHWFDAQRDLTPFYQLIHKEPKLQFMVTEFAGLRLMGIPDLYEALVWSVIGQQINLSFAYKLKRRLVENFGESIDFGGQKYWTLPQPAVLSQLSKLDLQQLQFSERKAEYLIEIGRQFAQGLISKENLIQLPTATAIQKLCSIRGIGIWTANYALMKSMHRLECIAYGDTGLQAAMHKYLDYPKKPDNQMINQFFENYKGWEAYLNFYLWHALSKK